MKIVRSDPLEGMTAPDAAPQGGGYGRMLIEKALPYQLGAQTIYELRPDGVRYTIDLLLGQQPEVPIGVEP